MPHPVWTTALATFAVSNSFAQTVGPSALANAYAPSFTPCPEGVSFIRSASAGISPQESTFISTREKGVQSGLSTYLTNLATYAKSTSNSTLPSYLTSNSTANLSPRVGISISGGGYRAALFGLSVVSALDGRNQTSSDAGLGGVLQSTLYMAGLSGGSWALGSLVQANFPTIPEIFFGPTIPASNASNTADNGVWGGWNSQNDILVANLSYIATIISEIAAKSKVFPVSFADVWSSALSRHFINGTTASNYFDDNASEHGVGATFRELADLPAASSGDMPFPIVLFNSRNQNTASLPNATTGNFIPLNNTIFEISPYEFGSWDAGLAAFTPTEFVGSTNTTTCMTGFAKAAFVIGTSSNLFNEFNTSATNLANSSIAPILPFLNASYIMPAPAGSLQKNVELVDAIWPNPFKGMNATTFPESSQEVLTLVDGGLDGEIVPLLPLVVRTRGLEVVFAIDATNDEGGFAAGSSIVASQNRTKQDTSLASIYPLPPLPTSIQAFLPTAQGGGGLASRPTFFGCGNFTDINGNQVTSGGQGIPLIIYIGNGGPRPGQPSVTNTSTFQNVYNTSQIQEFYDQTFEIATQGYSGMGDTNKDPEWPICLGCAIFEPARLKAANVSRDARCESCFSRYCWNGTTTTAANNTSSSTPSSSSSGVPSPSGSGAASVMHALNKNGLTVLVVAVAVALTSGIMTL